MRKSRSKSTLRTRDFSPSTRNVEQFRDKASIASEASSELRLLTKKHSLTKKTLSFAKAKKQENKDIITFEASIDSIDGIIATSTGRMGAIGQRDQPTFAIISYYKKVVSTGSAVKTNMLSLPLVKSSSSIGKRERYYAKFTEDDEPQSFNLSACMRRNSNYKSGYEPRELDFEISLMRGSEVMKLGTSTLVLHGNESGSIQLIPAGTTKTVTNTLRKAMIANKPSKTSVSSVTTAGTRTVSFSNDPTRKYTLQRSILRVTVFIKGEETVPSQYLQDPDHAPNSMMLSLGHSDSVSILSSGGVTTEVLKQKYKSQAEISKDATIGSSRSSIPKLNTQTASTEIDIDLDIESTFSGQDEYSRATSVDYNAQCGRGLNLMSSESEETEIESRVSSAQLPSFGSSSSEESGRITSFSDDESALLDEISIGTIKFKGIESADGSDGFEVISRDTQGRRLARTVSDIL